jgi:alpha-glucosidase
MKYILLSLIAGILFQVNSLAQEVKLYSPNRQIEVRIKTSPDMIWSVYYKGIQVLKESKIALQVNNGYLMGINQKLVSKKTTSIQKKEVATIPLRNAFHISYYKGMIFTFRVNNLRDYKIEFRVFDDGVGYRFITNFENELMVENELIQLNFPSGTETYFPQEHRYFSHFEQLYQHINMDTIRNDRFASLPLLMKSNGINMLFSEMDLQNYPNMFVLANEEGSLTGIFPFVVKETRPDPKQPDRNEIFVRQKREMALTFGKRNFPWRFFIISDKDEDLIDSEIPYSLASPQKIWETDWIKPGRVVWDWYSANASYQKQFGKEINTDTYKYYIDFASKYGFEYILMDEGWSKSTLEVKESKANIDMEEIIAYGKEKDVGVLLWLLWKPLDEDMDSILFTYNKWGIKGIKVDFMQRADQYMVKYYERVAKTAANYKLLVDFHGSFKPVGLSKAYPNVMTYEGLKGNENNKWSNVITPTHTLQLPFIRMAVGPMDFTPGAMRNAHANQFKISYDYPMSIGTRCRQLAMYVVYESPLQMLCDAPNLYEAEPEIPQIISQIPTLWDETKVLKATLGEEIVIARRKGNIWYLAAMTNSSERDIELILRDFLRPGTYSVQIIEDGDEATTNAQSFEISKAKITSNQRMQIHMVAGGGYLAIFKPMNGKKKKKKKQ